MAVINVTKDNFQKEVLQSSKPVLLDFWASWCFPCRLLSAVISKIASEHSEEVKVCKVNVDEAGDLAAEFQVASIPMLVVFKDGKATATAVGFKTKNQILALLQNGGARYGRL